MIKKLSDDTFFMYQGDTGTIGFVISGDYNVDDEYVFSIKKGLNYKPFISQTFKGTEFTAVIDEELTKLLPEGKYLWGLKLYKTTNNYKGIDTIIGTGTLYVKKGV